MVPLSDAIYLSISSIAGDDLRHNCLWPIACPVPGKISELRVYGFIRFIRNPTCAFAYFERWYLDSSYILFNLARKKNFKFTLVLLFHDFNKLERREILRGGLIFLVILPSQDKTDGSKGFSFSRGGENGGSLKISSLNRNDTVYIHIYTRKGTLLSGVAYPHIDIGLIESYPRGTSCRGDTCRSFIKDRQNKSRVKGLLVPYGTIELAQLAPSSTATIFSSTRTRIHGVLPACSSSPTLPIKKNRRWIIRQIPKFYGI